MVVTDGIKNIAQIVKSGGENAIEFFKKIFRIYYCSSFDYYPMCVCNCCSASSPEIASDNAQRSYYELMLSVPIGTLSSDDAMGMLFRIASP